MTSLPACSALPTLIQTPRPTPRIIGIYSPRPGSGKTTAALHLARKYGYILNPFAGPIKVMARALLVECGYSFDEAIFYTTHPSGKYQTIPEFGCTMRVFLQRLGTEFGRQQIHPDIWTNTWISSANVHMEAGRIVVVDDVRFPDEAEAIKALGGVMIHLSRPDAPASNILGHPSEGGLDSYKSFDRFIVNDGDMAFLEHNLALTLESLIEPEVAA